MNVREYLSRKYGVTVPTTITKMEAAMFGIPYPLRSGWLAEHGVKPIPQEWLAKLSKQLRKREAKQKRRGTKNIKHTTRALAVISNIGSIPDKPYTPRFWASPQEFYASPEWRRLRYQAIKFYGNRCQCCGATPGYGIVIHVDHIKPRSKFPQLELAFSNLQILCEDCNLGKSNLDSTDWRESTELDEAAVSHLRVIK